MVSRIVHIRPNFRLSSCLGSLKSKNFDPNKQQLFLFFAETLLNESKETDDNSTENGSNNGEMTSQLGSGGIDPSSMLAAREKTLISHAMDTLSRRVAENGSGGNGSDMSEPEDDAMELGIVDGLVIAEHLTNFHLATPTPMPSHLNIHFICETASRLLFLSVHWVRSIPVFAQLK